jgi:creatinine amidohydrolase
VRYLLILAGFTMLLGIGELAAAQTPGDFLGDLTWPEAEQRIPTAPLVVIPFGAGAKEHGPHLPMNADHVVMDYLLQQAVDSLPVLVAPPLLHGWFPAFREFPGTEVADPAAFEAYLLAVAESLVRQGARRLVFLNTGVSRATGLPIAIVAREIRVRTGIPTLVISWDDLETDEVASFTEQFSGGHADEIETSIHLVLQPSLVRHDAIPGTAPATPAPSIPGYRPGVFSRRKDDPAFSELGYSGDPSLASREKGERVLAIMTREWLRALRGFAETPVRGNDSGDR